jgi:acetyl-CoA acetyltransferase
MVLRQSQPSNAHDVQCMQVSDGAAVSLLMTRHEALSRGLPILGVFRSFAAVGVDPAIMGVGPAVAIPAAVKQAGLTLEDIDVYEINEAFASQALYCVRELGLPAEKVCLRARRSTVCTWQTSEVARHRLFRSSFGGLALP